MLKNVNRPMNTPTAEAIAPRGVGMLMLGMLAVAGLAATFFWLS